MKANKEIRITPTGKIEFTREAQKWIGRTKANKLFWRLSFDRYCTQDWGEVSEWRKGYNNRTMKRLNCLDTLGQYLSQDNTGYIQIIGEFDDISRDYRTLIDWINYQDSKPTKIEVKQPGRIIQLDINCY